jgi:endoglucanase
MSGGQACLVVVACVSALSSSCLTTPASETGFTKRTRELVPGACPGDSLIEDAEDGDNQILKREGRGGYWYTSVDAEGSSIEPATFKLNSEGAGHAGSRGVAHVKVKMASAGHSVYASLGFGLADPNGPYDASRYTGVTFWARGPAHVRFKVPDAYTAPGGGYCKDCYNDFGIELALTAEWQRYTVPFSWLSQQPGWGDPRPEVAADAIYALQWQVGSRGRSFDVYVDDIAFFCGDEGTEP